MPKRKRVRRNERAHGAGSVKQVRPGVFRAWRPPVAGTRPSRTFQGPDARERAERWLGGLDPGDGITLSLWLELWYARRYQRLRPNTRRNYEEYATYLEPLQDRPLAELDAAAWQRHLDLLLFGDPLLPEEQRVTYARGTVQAARAIWSGALSEAVRAGHLAANPLLDTVLPRATEQPPKAWRADEVARLLAGAAESASHYRAFLHLGLATGLRLGELRALRWRPDVDLLGLTVTVSRSLDNATDAAGPTKSGRVRVLDLPPETAAVLAEHRKRQPADCELVLGRPDGPYDAATFRTWLRRLCRRVGVLPLPPHSLRHTFASLAIASGVSIPAVSKALGHANPAITARVYAHFIEQHERRTASALRSALYGRPAVEPTASARESARE